MALIESAFVAIGKSTVLVGFGLVRPELYDDAIIRDGAVEVAAEVVSHAPVVQGADVERLKLQSPIEIDYRGVELVAVTVGDMPRL